MSNKHSDSWHARKEWTAMSKVCKGNEAETVTDTPIMLLINSATSEQLVTENIIDLQLIDFLSRAVFLDELLIDSDKTVPSMEVNERLQLECLPTAEL